MCRYTSIYRTSFYQNIKINSMQILKWHLIARCQNTNRVELKYVVCAHHLLGDTDLLSPIYKARQIWKVNASSIVVKSLKQNAAHVTSPVFFFRNVTNLVKFCDEVLGITPCAPIIFFIDKCMRRACILTWCGDIELFKIRSMKHNTIQCTRFWGYRVDKSKLNLHN